MIAATKNKPVLKKISNFIPVFTTFAMESTLTPKPRLYHFDIIKGVAIFLVIMGHVLTMCVRSIDRATVFKIIGQIHMPLFFFISGWFAYREDARGLPVLPKLRSRALQLLVPMVVVSSLWIYYFPHSGLESPLDSTWCGLWSNEWKNGYWFTPVLFEIILCYSAAVLMLRRVSSAAGACLCGAAVWGIMLLLSMCCGDVSSALNGWGSFSLATAYFPAFYFGAMGSRYRDGFKSALASSGLMTVAIIVFAITLYYCCWPWEMPQNAALSILVPPVMHIALAVITLRVFEQWSTAALKPGASALACGAASWWMLLGRESLAIYLLHYFFLFPMGVFRPWLEAVNVSFVPLAAFSALWALLISLCVLAVVRIISLSAPLAFMLTGKK